MKKECIQCGQVFIKKSNCSLKEWANKKFCSRKCKGDNQKGKSFFYPIGNTFRKGIKTSEEAKEKMRQAKLNNPVEYWKGKNRDVETKIKISIAKTGKKHSRETKIKMSLAKKDRFKGEDNPNWKGENLGYEGVHSWLEREFGKPHRCDNPNCSYKKTKRWDWALKTGLQYERKRQNFYRLCRSCHIKYDRGKILIN